MKVYEKLVVWKKKDNEIFKNLNKKIVNNIIVWMKL